MNSLYFLHGLDSSPQGFKACLLRQHYPQLVAPALTNKLSERLATQAEIIGDNAVVVGSSLGGLSALLFARDFPQRLAGLVLLAPAVGFYETSYRDPKLMKLVTSLVIPPGIPTHVITGRRDEVIPLADVEALVARSPSRKLIHLEILDDDHLLHSEAAQQALLTAIGQLMV